MTPMVREDGCWIGVNTSLTNKLVEEGLRNGVIDDFGRIDSILREVKVSGQSRLDFLVKSGKRDVYIEVKNCSLAENNVALFPDAVTKRGTKHLLELDRQRRSNVDSAILFCVQRKDADSFMPAEFIDPEYTKTLYNVHKNGVKVIAYQADVQPERVLLVRKIPVFAND